MNNAQKRYILSALFSLVAVAFLGGIAYFYMQHKSGENIEAGNRVSPNTLTDDTKTISNSFPPLGWYVHNSSDLPMLRNDLMLTKQKTYPAGHCENTEFACFGTQIRIHDIDTSRSDEMMKYERGETSAIVGEPYESFESFVSTKVLQSGVTPLVQKWSTRDGFKSFRMTYTSDYTHTPTEVEYVYLNNKVREFSLFPKSSDDLDAFDQVAEHYTQGAFGREIKDDAGYAIGIRASASSLHPRERLDVSVANLPVTSDAVWNLYVSSYPEGWGKFPEATLTSSDPSVTIDAPSVYGHYYLWVVGKKTDDTVIHSSYIPIDVIATSSPFLPQ